jgi:hypothetical protein
MDVTLYFMSSPPVISTVRAVDAGLSCAAAGTAGATGAESNTRETRPDASDERNMLRTPRKIGFF